MVQHTPFSVQFQLTMTGMLHAPQTKNRMNKTNTFLSAFHRSIRTFLRNSSQPIKITKRVHNTFLPADELNASDAIQTTFSPSIGRWSSHTNPEWGTHTHTRMIMTSPLSGGVCIRSAIQACIVDYVLQQSLLHEPAPRRSGRKDDLFLRTLSLPESSPRGQIQRRAYF